MPTTERERVVLDPPPSLEPDEGASGVLVGAVPTLASLGSMALVATMALGGVSGRRSLLAAGAFLLGTLGFLLVQLDRQRVRRGRARALARRAYLRHLADARARLVSATAGQRERALRRHPPSGTALLACPDDRAADDGTGLTVRFAEGPAPPDVEVVATAADDRGEPDPAVLDARQRLLSAYATVPGLPLTVDLTAVGHLTLAGEPDAARALARILVCRAAAARAPDRLAVAVLAEPSRSSAWEWLKWLPHAHHPHQRDRAGPRRLTGASVTAIAPPPGPLLLVVDGADPDLAAVDRLGEVVVLEVAPTLVEETGTRIRLGRDGTATLLAEGSLPVTGSADGCGAVEAEAVARRLLSRAARTRAAVPNDTAPGPDHLAAPLGTAADGRPLLLDLEEAARGGVGPHGLVVGATGSGKSELLRSLVLGLASRHSPERLALVLVDFKGGATFAGLAPLPHVAGLVTNLADDLALVDRMQDALAGELLRRQQLLRDAGDLASAHDLRRARAAGAALPALPSLLVVVDEFAEMLAARPELLEVVTAIGRLGRSLGVHLLLATQRLDEGRLRGLEAHLSYRVALRTFTAAESRAAIGVPDAADLPRLPGSGLLRTGPGEPVRFRAAHVSGPVPPPATVDRVVPFTLAPQPLTGKPTTGEATTVLDRTVARLTTHGARARPVWLPPLDRPDTLGRLLGPLTVDPRLGLVAARTRDQPLRLPLGTLDRPREQRAEPWWVDLSGAGGHVAVLGAPRSGRTTVLHALVAGIVLTRTPGEAQVLLVDLAGGGLAPLAPLPHVAAYAPRSEPDVVRRVVAHAAAVVDERGAAFDSEDAGELFVVVDGWPGPRDDLLREDIEASLARVATRGLTVGVHLLVSAGRAADLRAGTRDLFGTRVELRLGDPLDSEVDRRAARLVPQDRPGRGLAASGHHVLTALPRLDDDPDPPSARAGLADLVARVTAAWPGSAAPSVGRLPETVDLADLRRLAGHPPYLLLGHDDRTVVGIDPIAEPHLLVLGDPGSGRTTALRTLLSEVVRTRRPDQAQVVLLDPRRGLRDVVAREHLLGHHTSATTAAPALQELADHLRRRLPGPEVTADQLHERSWWQGAEVVVMVDDHELLVVGAASPLAPLLPLLPYATDVGLRLLLARRTAGAARALHDPELRALRELGAPVLLLPGSPSEGPLAAGLTPGPGPPGRARLVTGAGGCTELQVGLIHPDR